MIMYSKRFIQRLKSIDQDELIDSHDNMVSMCILGKLMQDIS